MTSRIFAATAILTVAAIGTAEAAPVQWGGNGHWYELITDDTQSTFVGALSAAAGLTWTAESGYIATVTSALEQAFLNTLNPNNVTAWLGEADARLETEWRWLNGPEAGKRLAIPIGPTASRIIAAAANMAFWGGGLAISGTILMTIIATLPMSSNTVPIPRPFRFLQRCPFRALASARWVWRDVGANRPERGLKSCARGRDLFADGFQHHGA